MKINELANEKNIKLSKFDFSCDDIDETIPLPLPQALNFFMLISGKPGSGKTSLILNLLCKRGKNYNRKFDKVFIFSPSLITMKNDPFSEIPEEQKFQELNEEILENVLDDIADTGDKVLLIMDDVVNDITKNKFLQRFMNKILMNRRHLAGFGGSVSVIMTTQVYNKIPAPIRKSASHIIIYHTKNKKELDNLFDELILIPKTEFYEILKYIFQRKHDFMYLDTNKDFDKMFHRNFNQLVFDLPDLDTPT
tara:strand:+ start:86 stop:838 length:753 start_codon:yes stop_codon:yes gene_type:complete